MKSVQAGTVDPLAPGEAPPAANVEQGAGEPELSEQRILEALQKITSSKGFDAPDRSRRLLEYIVKEGLGGRSNRIKSYTIATEVFGRPSSFDPQKDPIVRIEAGRMRRALEHYYLTDGRDDTVVIDIPKGSYSATFSLREPAASSEAVSGAPPDLPEESTARRPAVNRRAALSAFLLIVGVLLGGVLLWSWTTSNQQHAYSNGVYSPGVIIKPLADLTRNGASEAITQGLTERIIERASRFRELTVIASEGGTMKPSTSIARYEFGGTVRIGNESLLVQTRLVDRTDGRVIWADNLETRLEDSQSFDVETAIANQIAARIGEPNAVILKVERDSSLDASATSWETYMCTLRAYAYRAKYGAGEHAEVRACLETAVAEHPDYATAWALLALVYVDEIRFFYPPPPGNDTPALERAHEAAQRAIELDAGNIRSQQAMMMTLFFNGNHADAIAIGKKALTLNPNDIEFKGDYGYRLALTGEWEEGCRLVREALDMSARKTGYHTTALALCSYIRKDMDEAADLIIEAAAIDNPAYHLIAAAFLAEAGRPEEAAVHRNWLDQNASPQLPVLLRDLPRRMVRPEDQERFVNSLRKAGFGAMG